ncbi:hypothetical protein LMG33818_000435 [Halomonadaceae bacterium LMG 33818]|uniref:GNAT family N-acetyltransferase n=1 Tax=Cernens ardua TaxID=3402176 RepID=UPI003EDC5325
MIVRKIDLVRDFNQCISARKDAYLCSFGTLSGVEKILSGYRERVEARLNDSRFYYYHVWDKGRIIGQLEFRSCWEGDLMHSLGWKKEKTGYLYLIYIAPEYRGSGVVNEVHDLITTTLTREGCKRVVLSVSTMNERAMRFYKKKGWYYLSPNPKHATTEFWGLALT